MKTKLLFGIGISLLSGMAFAQQNSWSTIYAKNIPEARIRTLKVTDYKLLSLNQDQFVQQLTSISSKNNFTQAKSLIKFPDENGTVDVYEVTESSTMHPDLQSKYSDIRSFVGVKVGDPTSKITFTYDPYFGLNATLKNTKGTYYIDSYSQNNKIYMMYNRNNASPERNFQCLFQQDEAIAQTLETASQDKTVIDGQMRKYRLALATAVEYTAYISQQAGVADGTNDQKKAAVMSALNLVVNRLNEVFTNELSLKLELVPNTDLLIFIDSDNYDPVDAGSMLDINQTNVDNIIGSANYDIGHVFFQAQEGNDNGVAYKPSVCNNRAKAGGVTGSANPVGDPFVIDFVAHEMGHQFGADHTQNNRCNRNNSTSIEPGSASSIMGYAGICAPNVQRKSDDYYHAVSIRQMYNYISRGNGRCSVNNPTGNNAPIVNAGVEKTIPKETPFVLVGAASDADGDAITYNWEQIDAGAATMPPRPVNAVGPMFRTLPSTTSPERYFPRLSTIVEGYNATIISENNYRSWEKLSSVERTLNFSLTVRDNNPVGGQSGRADVKLNVTADAGPFLVTSQSASGIVWNLGESNTITWNVANTDVAPVNTTNVKILISTDGGLTFPHTLVESTPNNGSYTFNVPGGLGVTDKARFMIKAVDNVFLNVNTVNFKINSNLSTNEVSRVNEFTIYPNPSKGIFTLEANVSKNLSYSVYTMDGKQVSSKKEVSSKSGKVSENVNLSNLTSGVYIIKVENDGQTASKKLIINK
ncbi:reprolysin-like metallopeptidase [Chryseobacterium sp. T1]